jgi:hypothetical protein
MTNIGCRLPGAQLGNYTTAKCNVLQLVFLLGFLLSGLDFLETFKCDSCIVSVNKLYLICFKTHIQIKAHCLKTFFVPAFKVLKW